MQSIYLKRIYLVIAIVAFFMCWSQNIAYFHLGPIQATWQFIQDTMVNPASRSITFDIIFFFMAAAVFMWVEGRRLKVPYLWVYFTFGLLIAISVTFPLFLIARQKSLDLNSSMQSL
ncbi:MAG TPA: DUF2834 domain-containing protein [Bacteriovoracaceae bacterium]|nr:DUF2834 domain-containing protein [Bacteriovoracaceae bacterium]